jgi:phospholipid/cholesterol/gamma-HCH transport system permease protein
MDKVPSNQIPRKRSTITRQCLRLADIFLSFKEEISTYVNFLKKCLFVLGWAILNPTKVKWRQVAFYSDVSGSDATPIVSLLGFLIGVILAFQAIIQLGRFGVQNYVINLVGTVIVTELAPLVTAVVLAGRTGSAFAAELSAMKSEEELDALTTLGINQEKFLILPKLLAMLIVTPFLTIISDICGILGGMTIVTSMLNISITEYLNKTFEVIQFSDLSQGICKGFFFGAIVSTVGCMKGLNSRSNAQGIGQATTSAVVISIFLIVVTDAIITACFGLSLG